MSFVVTEEELWPHYVISDEGGYSFFGRVVEIPDELLKEASEVSSKFFEVQEKLRKLFNEAPSNPR